MKDVYDCQQMEEKTFSLLELLDSRTGHNFRKNLIHFLLREVKGGAVLR
jgi:hypothetical protein